LTRDLSDSQIADVLAAHTCAQTAADRLVDLASQAGGLDNITAVVVRPTPRAGGPRSGVRIVGKWFSGLAGQP
jgi:serine/threonine protein phosphatase PrpC